jgi:hypothetical protein
VHVGRLATDSGTVRRLRADIIDKAIQGPTFDEDLLQDDIERAYSVVADLWSHRRTSLEGSVMKHHISVSSSRSARSRAAATLVMPSSLPECDAEKLCGGSSICTRTIADALPTLREGRSARVPHFFQRCMGIRYATVSANYSLH